MSWFKFMIDAHSNPKIRALRDAEFRLLTHIWALAARSSEAGVVRLTEHRGLTPVNIAIGAGCEAVADPAGEQPDEMVQQLVELGLITRDSRGVITVHDWTEYNGIRPSWERPQRAAQKRKERARRTPVAPESHGGRNGVAPPSHPGRTHRVRGRGREEEDQDRGGGGDHVGPAADPALRAPPSPWSSGLLEALFAATGKDWQNDDLVRFLKAVQRYPQQQVEAAVQEFLRRGPEVHRKPLASYLLAMVRDGAGQNPGNGDPARSAGHEQGPPPEPPPPTREELEAQLEAQGRAILERREAGHSDPQSTADEQKSRRP